MTSVFCMRRVLQVSSPGAAKARNSDHGAVIRAEREGREEDLPVTLFHFLSQAGAKLFIGAHAAGDDERVEPGLFSARTALAASTSVTASTNARATLARN